jgi:hypothetical protein
MFVLKEVLVVKRGVSLKRGVRLLIAINVFLGEGATPLEGVTFEIMLTPRKRSQYPSVHLTLAIFTSFL